MSLTSDVYNAFKAVVTIQSRLEQLSRTVADLSDKVDATTERLTAKTENHAERLARLEGKFELVETSLGARRRKLPE